METYQTFLNQQYSKQTTNVAILNELYTITHPVVFYQNSLQMLKKQTFCT